VYSVADAGAHVSRVRADQSPQEEVSPELLELAKKGFFRDVFHDGILECGTQEALSFFIEYEGIGAGLSQINGIWLFIIRAV